MDSILFQGHFCKKSMQGTSLEFEPDLPFILSIRISVTPPARRFTDNIKTSDFNGRYKLTLQGINLFQGRKNIYLKSMFSLLSFGNFKGKAILRNLLLCLKWRLIYLTFSSVFLLFTSRCRHAPSDKCSCFLKSLPFFSS